MCFGGGGGGDPAAEQRQLEAERQAKIDKAVAEINAAFDKFGGGGRGVASESNPEYLNIAQPIYDRYLVEAGSSSKYDPANPEGFLAVSPENRTRAYGEVNKEFNTPKPDTGDFYSGVSKSFLDYYQPQFEDQAEKARRNFVLSSPTTSSSAYARGAGDLEKEIARQQAAIQSKAADAATQKKASIEGNRSDLITQATVGGGMAGAAGRASSLADIQSRPTSYSPLEELFATLGTNEANRIAAERAGYNTKYKPVLFGGPKYGSTVSGTA